MFQRGAASDGTAVPTKRLNLDDVDGSDALVMDLHQNLIDQAQQGNEDTSGVRDEHISGGQEPTPQSQDQSSSHDDDQVLPGVESPFKVT